MKNYLLTLALTSLGLAPVLSAQEEHHHASTSGENCCNHAHGAGEHAEAHDHANCSGHDHAHGEGEHAEAHDHANCSGHDHAHGEGEHAEGHDHANCSGHDHAHGEGEHAEAHDHANCSGHDHAHGEGEHAEGHDHANCSGHDHAHGEGEHAEAHDHANCSGHDHAHGDAGHADGPVLVTADARSRQMLRMRIETVPQADLALTHSLYGYLTATEHAMETYSLPCAGRITLAVKSAQSVKKGDVLYTVVSPEVGAQEAELRTAQAALTRCNEELATVKTRLEKLQAIGTANSDLESEYKFKSAEQAQMVQGVAVAESRLRMLLMDAELQHRDGMAVLVVRAKNDGTVRNVGITQGSWGEQGAAIVTMSNTAAMEIVATLYAGDYPQIERVRATMPIGREQLAVEGAWRLDEQVDMEKQTRKLYFTPTELPDGARAGQLCRLDLYAGSGKGGQVSIPDAAVVRVGVDDVVFIEVKEGTFAMVKVHAGVSRRGMTPVEGLVPGQRIVVKGGAELRYLLPADGQKKKSAGHFHADGKFHEGEH